VRDLHLCLYLTEDLSVFSNLAIRLLSLFMFWNLFQNGCQFNMSMNVSSCFSVSFNSHCVSLEAGAKVEILFLTGKKILKFFLEILSPVFFSFLISLSRNVACFAGCKCNFRFSFSQAFFEFYSKINFRFNSFGLSVCIRTAALLRVQK
jgi:hypothetical protein